MRCGYCGTDADPRLHVCPPIAPRTLGGDGALNLPFEGTGRIDRPGGDFVLTTGFVWKAAVLPHPFTGDPHPVVIFQMAMPDGSKSPEYLLLVERQELDALAQLAGDTVASAVAAANGAHA